MNDQQDLPQNISERIIILWHTYKIPILLGGLSIFVIVTSLILLVKSSQSTLPIQFSSNIAGVSDSTDASRSANPPAGGRKMIHVDVEGGVERPGVYSLPLGSRVDDAIAIAGGISNESDLDALAKQLNRASVLVDGGKIYVPKKGEVSVTSHNTGTLLQHQEMSQNVQININTASQNELEALPGIGPVTAKKIIDNRPYQTLEELVSKKALGQALFEKIKGKLSL